MLHFIASATKRQNRFTRLQKAAMTALLLFTLLMPAAVWADVTCCISHNDGLPCVSTCYVTDLTCADITIGAIIRSCQDMVFGGGIGGATGSGMLSGISPAFDGQVNIGDGPLPGTVDIIASVLQDFYFTRPVSPHINLDQFIQVLGIDAGGNIYRADVPTAGLNRFGSGDLVIQVTRAGQTIYSPFEAVPTGQLATGDYTISVATIDRTNNITPLSFDYTPVTLANLAWTLVGSGAVPTNQASWGTMKSDYR